MAFFELEGVDRVLHAGDIGDPDILDVLASIAPMTAIRGNIDRGHWAEALPETVDLAIESLSFRRIMIANAREARSLASQTENQFN